MADRHIVCADCVQPFLFTEREWNYLHDLFRAGKLPELCPPKRCKPCRDARKPPEPQSLARDRAPLSAPILIPASVKPAPPPLPIPAPKPLPTPPPPCADLRVVLVAGDFDQLVQREEVEIHLGHHKVILRLADIGPIAMKQAMEKAILAWLKS